MCLMRLSVHVHNIQLSIIFDLRFLSLFLLFSNPFTTFAFEIEDEDATLPALGRGGSALDVSAAAPVSLLAVAFWLIFDMVQSVRDARARSVNEMIFFKT
jgi:hypothetical protein